MGRPSDTPKKEPDPTTRLVQLVVCCIRVEHFVKITTIDEMIKEWQEGDP